MYLKSLETIGFKSFAEAKMEFPEGITAIVGPNGSGKSNVVDAILWVLGEQSAKTLRSERMDDVIFNGTQLRKPMGMAEVSLVIGGVDHMKLEGGAGLPIQLHEFQELMITRRLYRNGDSEYLINKAPCRLKDVRSLLLDTRAGSKGHTVIEQGRIEQILNASPQDRRELIEETAGIVRYKKQKTEALRKLDATQQNLLRVRDIIAEVRKQLNSLERQARQARTYQALHQEARALEIELLVGEFQGLKASLRTIEKEANDLAAREAGHNAEEARLNAELESIRLKITIASDAMTRIREELGRVEQQQGQAIASAEKERSRVELFAQQREQASQDLSRVTKEREQAEAESVVLRNRLAQIEADLAGRAVVLAELEHGMGGLLEQRTAVVSEEEQGRRDHLKLTVQVTSCETTLTQLAARGRALNERRHYMTKECLEVEGQQVALHDQLQSVGAHRGESERQCTALQAEGQRVREEAQQLAQELSEVEQQLTRQLEELAATESRLATLQGIVREEMGYGRQGDEEETALRACQGVKEALAEWLVVPSGLDRAVEAILGDQVRGWFVDTPFAAKQAVEFLKQKDLGRGAFIPLQPRWSTEGTDTLRASWWPALAGESGVVGRAVDLVQSSTESSIQLACLFDGIVIVDTLEVAVQLWERYQWSAPYGPTLVTLSGEVLSAAGIMMGGGVSESSGLLQRRREVQEIQTRRGEAVTLCETIRLRREQLVARAQMLREKDQHIADALHEAEMSSLSLAKDLTGLQQNLGDLKRRLEATQADLLRGQDERQGVETEVQAGTAQLAKFNEERAALETGLAALSMKRAQVEEEIKAQQQRLTEARLAVEGLRAWREHGEADFARLLRTQEESKHRVLTLEEQIISLAIEIQTSNEERSRQEALCQALGEQATQVKADLVSAQEKQADEMVIVQQIEQKLVEIRRTLASNRDARMAVEVRRAQVNTQLAAVESTLTGTYQLTPSTLLETPAEEPALSDERRVQGGGEETALPDRRAELQKIRERLDRMGPINLAAIEEHRELEERHTFLVTQEQDLSNSIGSLKEIIQRINRTTKEMFLTTFTELQEKFGEVFTQFFPGGRAELVLVDEPVVEGEPQSANQEPGVDIVAQPPGKRLKGLSMLSGGEKTLTAMALLFASFLIRPTPFCILDEIDAPLDEENIGRFTGVLRELSSGAQFMVITHNKRTMSVADSLFGVTMEEPGISKLVSVRLGDLQLA